MDLVIFTNRCKIYYIVQLFQGVRVALYLIQIDIDQDLTEFQLSVQFFYQAYAAQNSKNIFYVSYKFYHKPKYEVMSLSTVYFSTRNSWTEVKSLNIWFIGYDYTIYCICKVFSSVDEFYIEKISRLLFYNLNDIDKINSLHSS